MSDKPQIVPGSITQLTTDPLPVALRRPSGPTRVTARASSIAPAPKPTRSLMDVVAESMPGAPAELQELVARLHHASMAMRAEAWRTRDAEGAALIRKHCAAFEAEAVELIQTKARG